MPKRIDFSVEQIAKMGKMHREGKSTRDLASVFGCGRQTIASTLSKAGVEMNGRAIISAKMTGKPGRRAGAIHTPESLAKMSASRKKRGGTRFGPHSTETLAKISAATKGKNVKHTPEARLEIERIRQRCKRFVKRVLRATGKRKLILSEQYLGYTTTDLLNHLGPAPFPSAHLDHRVPIVEFIKRGITSPSVINALHNLQWLSAEENQRKSGTVPQDADEIINICRLAENGWL